MLESLADGATYPCNTDKGQQRKARTASHPNPGHGRASRGWVTGKGGPLSDPLEFEANPKT